MTEYSTLIKLGFTPLDTTIAIETLLTTTKRDVVAISVDLDNIRDFTNLESLVTFNYEYYESHSQFTLNFSCSLGSMLDMIEAGSLIIMGVFKENLSYRTLKENRFTDNSLSFAEVFNFPVGSELFCSTCWSTRYGHMFLKDKDNNSRNPEKGVLSPAPQAHVFYDPRFFEVI
jgi:hypothetical protein